jgi:hypothetical protein
LEFAAAHAVVDQQEVKYSGQTAKLSITTW